MALATTPTFDFYLDGGAGLIDTVSNSPSFVSGGIALVVTAKQSNGSAAHVANRRDGLGVSGSSFLGIPDAGEIVSGESLILTFNRVVTLTGLQLSLWDRLIDDATLTVGSKTIDLGASSSSGLVVNEFSFSNLSGTQLTPLLSFFCLPACRTPCTGLVASKGAQAIRRPTCATGTPPSTGPGGSGRQRPDRPRRIPPRQARPGRPGLSPPTP